MSDRPQSEPDDVVRARRIELVDGDGRLRGVVGEVEAARHRGDSVIGVELYTQEGEPRASLALSGGRAWLMFEMGGNARLHVGVNDESTEAVDEQAFFYVLDPDGLPLAGWRVADDGTAIEHPL